MSARTDRINELARISKVRPLSPDEVKEQKALREEYLLEFRTKLRAEPTNSSNPTA